MIVVASSRQQRVDHALTSLESGAERRVVDFSDEAQAGDAFRWHTSMVLKRYLCGQVHHSRNLIGGGGGFASRVVICYLVIVMTAKEWRLASGRNMSKSKADQSRQIRPFVKVPR